MAGSTRPSFTLPFNSPLRANGGGIGGVGASLGPGIADGISAASGSVGTVEATGGMTGNTIGNSSPRIVTEEKLKCYDKFRGLPIMIEGPEFIQDFSYFL